MRKKAFGFFGCYAVTATVAFVLTMAGAAKAGTIFTVAGFGCTIVAANVACGLPAGSAVSAVGGGISRTYFDYRANGSTRLQVYKQTVSGTSYGDFASFTDPTGRYVEHSVVSNELAGAPRSPWDYYSAVFTGPNFTTTTQNVLGVGYITVN